MDLDEVAGRRREIGVRRREGILKRGEGNGNRRGVVITQEI